MRSKIAEPGGPGQVSVATDCVYIEEQWLRIS